MTEWTQVTWLKWWQDLEVTGKWGRIQGQKFTTITRLPERERRDRLDRRPLSSRLNDLGQHHAPSTSSLTCLPQQFSLPGRSPDRSGDSYTRMMIPLSVDRWVTIWRRLSRQDEKEDKETQVRFLSLIFVTLFRRDTHKSQETEEIAMLMLYKFCLQNPGEMRQRFYSQIFRFSLRNDTDQLLL